MYFQRALQLSWDSLKMSLVIVSLVLALSSPACTAPASQCACASVDTVIERVFGSKDNSFGTLSSPSCLPYQGDQKAINDGRIYAHVLYQGQNAWLLTSDIYIKNCHESFDCVCATAAVDVLTGYGTGSTTMTTLTSGQCVTLQGKTYNSTAGTWLQVNANNKIGWIKKGNVVFHENCGGHSQAASSVVQLPGCPKIITRAEWGARAPRSPHVKLAHTPYYAFIHHGATAGCFTRGECVRMIQSYQNFHMDGHGWSDIGYSFVIGEDGNVYEGRGWDAVGAHTYNYNSRGLGFCVIGNFMQRLPHQAAQDVLQKIIACGVSNGKLTSTYTMLGHRDVGGASGATSCPGDMFYALIQKWPHYNAPVIPSTK
ncbi:uncharacterized protein LOC124132936 [Haliotis rufescens]|uniref:uncharacterized protein LOC124132936 n=1 Tax=Haliotis rufescens TaxID=6454 RepID=UPI00201F6F6A|nr:uncharacterized protein LOC124132936 [Haliotis rufescens]